MKKFPCLSDHFEIFVTQPGRSNLLWTLKPFYFLYSYVRYLYWKDFLNRSWAFELDLATRSCCINDTSFVNFGPHPAFIGRAQLARLEKCWIFIFVLNKILRFILWDFFIWKLTFRKSSSLFTDSFETRSLTPGLVLSGLNITIQGACYW